MNHFTTICVTGLQTLSTLVCCVASWYYVADKRMHHTQLYGNSKLPV